MNLYTYVEKMCKQKFRAVTTVIRNEGKNSKMATHR